MKNKIPRFRIAFVGQQSPLKKPHESTVVCLRQSVVKTLRDAVRITFLLSKTTSTVALIFFVELGGVVNYFLTSRDTVL